MSDATKGAGDDGQPRFRRSWFEHAGEVTKKKEITDKADVSPTEGPPRPTGPKIGGARDFRRTTPSAVNADNENGAFDSDLLTTGGVQVTDSTCTRSLAAQPGWRRYWSTVTAGEMHDWERLPDLKVSGFCYECYEHSESCDGPQLEPDLLGSNACDDAAVVACGGCVRQKRECLFIISYRFHPDEDWDIGRMPESMRRFALNWQAAQKGPLAIATRTTTSAPLPPPAWLRPKTLSRTAEKPKPVTTTQRVPLEYQRAAYEDLAEIYIKDSYIENPNKIQQSRPYWEHPLHARSPIHQARARPPNVLVVNGTTPLASLPSFEYTGSVPGPLNGSPVQPYRPGVPVTGLIRNTPGPEVPAGFQKPSSKPTILGNYTTPKDLSDTEDESKEDYHERRTSLQ